MADNSHPIGTCAQCCGGPCSCGPDFWKGTLCEGKPTDTNCVKEYCAEIIFDYSGLPGGGLQPNAGPLSGTYVWCSNPGWNIPTRYKIPLWCYWEKSVDASFFTSSNGTPCYPNYNTFNPGREPPNKHNLCFNLAFKAGDFEASSELSVQLPVELGVWTIWATGKFVVKSCEPLLIEAVLDDKGWNCAYDPAQNESNLPIHGRDRFVNVVGYYPGGHYSTDLLPCSLVGLGLNPYNCTWTLRPYLVPRVKTTIRITERGTDCGVGPIYGGEVAYWWCTPGGVVQAVARPGLATSGPYNSKADASAVCGTVITDPFWCVSGSCVQAKDRPLGSTAGPFPTMAGCSAGCSPPTSDPFWCVSGTCGQSATQPAGGSGPFASMEECSKGCQPPSTLKWWCVFGVLVQAEASPHGDALGPFDDPQSANCGPGEMVWICGDDGISRAGKWDAIQHGWTYWETEEAARANCHPRWWCTPQGCQQRLDEPPDAIGVPSGTQAECEASCVPPPPSEVGYYCLQSGTNKTCVFSYTRPNYPASVILSGPFATVEECNRACGTSSLPGGGPAPGDPVLDPASRRVLIQRVSVPCVHLGPEIEDPAKCGCGTAVLRSCAIYGECRRTGVPKAGERICSGCEEYKAGETG